METKRQSQESTRGGAEGKCGKSHEGMDTRHMGPLLNSVEFRFPGNSEDLLRSGNKGTAAGSAGLEGDPPSSSEAARRGARGGGDTGSRGPVRSLLASWSLC